MANESDLKALIQAFLHHEAFPIKTACAAPVESYMGRRGVDLYICMNGKFIAWEAKLGNKPPTTRQQEHLDFLAAAKAETACVHSVRQCVAWLRLQDWTTGVERSAMLTLYNVEFSKKDKKFIMLYDKSVLKTGGYGELVK
jgi:hypothetical protein